MNRAVLLPILTALVLPTLAMIPSCASSPNEGYHFGTNYDESIRTISVPIFQNDTLQRGLELTLAESLNKQIRAKTPWALAKSDKADTTLVGVITAHTLTELSQSPRTGLVQEQIVRVTVNFEWRDNRTGDILIARNGFAASSTFVPQRGVGERIEHGQRQAIEELATDIIAQLRQNW